MTRHALFSRAMPRHLEKRSLTLTGHATSVALEPEFWAVLEEMSPGAPLARLIVDIDAGRGERPLASACRLAALEHLRGRAGG